MKLKTVVVTLIVLSLIFSPLTSHPPAEASAAPGEFTGALQFIENTGQFAPEARFLVRGGGVEIWLAEDAIWISQLKTDPLKVEKFQVEGSHHTNIQPFDKLRAGSSTFQLVNLKLSFPGANPHPQMEPLDRLDIRINYYIGSDSTQWQTNVPVWGGVRYVDLYPGIDLEITGEANQWRWRLVSEQRSTFDDVQLRVEGAESVSVDGNALRLTTALGEFALSALQAEGYQLALSPSQPSTFNLQPATFHLPPANFDLPPATPADSPATLAFSTFLGGASYDDAKDIAVDETGLYIIGYTMSANFPTTPGLDEVIGGDSDIFVSKLSLDGKNLLYSTFLGGSHVYQEGWVSEAGNAIAIGQDGSAYLTGYTWSADFPVTQGAYDTTHNLNPNADPNCRNWYCRSDVFIAKLDTSGSLDYSTYLGGSYLPYGVTAGGEDVGYGIAVDSQGVVYTTGFADSYDFPTTPGAYKRVYSHEDWGMNDDIFLAKLNPAGNGAADLLYCTFIGGAWEERGEDIVVDENGVAYITGYYRQSGGGAEFFDFPTTPGAYDPGPVTTIGDYEAFVIKFDPAGNGANDLMYATLIGPDPVSGVSGWDEGLGIARDSAGYVYIVGRTDGVSFPTTAGAFDTTCGTDGGCNWRPLFGNSSDLFIAKFNLAGNGASDLLYSTFLGGNFVEAWDGADIAIDGSGDVYVSSDSWSDKGYPITPGALDSTLDTDYYEAVLTRLHLGGQGAGDLVYSTFLGGATNPGGQPSSSGHGIAVPEAGIAYVVGETDTEDFPVTAGAFDTTFNGVSDVFAAKFLTVAPDTGDVDAWVDAPPLVGAPPEGGAAIPVAFGNLGATTASSVTITATLGVSLTYVGDTSGITPTINGNLITWQLPDIGLWESGEFLLQVSVPDDPYGTRYSVTLQIASAGPEASPANDSDNLEVMVARRLFLPLVRR